MIVDPNDPQVKAAIEQCKKQADSNPQLSADAKSKIGEVCEEAGSGDADGAIKATREACEIIVEDKVHPSTQHLAGSRWVRSDEWYNFDRNVRGDAHVLLDCSAIPEHEIRQRFPNILRETAERGTDMLREPLPVVPAAESAIASTRSGNAMKMSARRITPSSQRPPRYAPIAPRVTPTARCGRSTSPTSRSGAATTLHT